MVHVSRLSLHTYHIPMHTPIYISSKNFSNVLKYVTKSPLTISLVCCQVGNSSIIIRQYIIFDLNLCLSFLSL